MNRKTLACAAIALSLAVAACSDSVADSAADLCGSLEALGDTMKEVAGADASADATTVESVQSAVAEVESAVQDVRDTESDLSDALNSQLQEDFQDLQAAIEDIPGDSTLAEAGEDVVSALAAFKTSWDQTLAELNCSTDG